MSSKKGRINWAKRKTKVVELDELGEKVTLRELGVAQIISDSKTEDPDTAYKQLANAIIDDEGLVYSADSPEDINELKEMSPSVFKQLMDALNTLHDGGRIDDLKKKSEEAPSTPSDSVSQ